MHTLCSSENLNGRSWLVCWSVTLLMIRSRVSSRTSEVLLSLILTCNCMRTTQHFRTPQTKKLVIYCKQLMLTWAVPPTVLLSKCTDRSTHAKIGQHEEQCHAKHISHWYLSQYGLLLLADNLQKRSDPECLAWLRLLSWQSC